MTKFNKLFETGRTMLEMLAVLAILGFISISATNGIQHALMIYRASTLQTQLPQIKKAIENTYSFSGDYTGLNTASEGQYKSMFEDILGQEACTGSSCKTPGGRFYLSSIAGGSGFKITFVDMPRDICLEIADTARGDNNVIMPAKMMMANSCNDNNVQQVEFASLIGNPSQLCPGNQIWDGSECSCLNPNAIGEDCTLPSL